MRIKIDMKRIFQIAPIVLLLFSYAFAYEPPSTHPKEALEKCTIAFIGRIIEIKETSNGKNISEANAKIIINKKIRGLVEYDSDVILMKYSSRYFMPIPYHGFEPDLYISRVYLFVINRPFQKGTVPLLFNPSYKEKIDLADQFSNDPDFSLMISIKIKNFFRFIRTKNLRT